MKKKLRLEELRVEAFATADAAANRGTVRGHEDVLGGYTVTAGACSCSGPYQCICWETQGTPIVCC